MSRLFLFAWLAALCGWIPLLWLVLRQGARVPGRMIRLAIAAGLLALLYEAWMTFVWGPTVVAPIRVDLLYLVPVLGVFYGMAALQLFLGRRRMGPDSSGRITLIITGLLCISIPVAAFIGWTALSRSGQQLVEDLEAGRQYRFEAAFRDDSTLQRFFGNLEPATNHWPGYYASADPDSRFSCLIINSEGKIWLYRHTLHVMHGQQEGDSFNQQTFSATAQDGVGGSYRISLAGQSATAATLTVSIRTPDDAAGWRQYGQPVHFVKTRPPAFPQHPSPADSVRFLGVFSGRTAGKSASFRVIQLWLWESQGTAWGRYLHNYFTPGRTSRLLSTQPVAITCNGPCAELDLSFKTDRGHMAISRSRSGELLATLPGLGEPVELQRGAIVPGFILDLAPLATQQQNTDWLRAVSAGQFVEWTVPGPFVPTGSGDPG